ncbi:hypothetical protein K474DRAFT_1688085 [Panus rudis PR-1116 ss-1]|nr:hypothetical protein K474DRAFT_1688085 [Panus rudis PR-1116 ss-1]
MFGNPGITSTWGQSQQNQQQPQGTTAFGQPAATPAFGAGTGAFGSGGAFGQPQQPQQQANPMFGGAAANPAPATGFGAFGNTNNANTTTGGIFGQPKPATGFGAFGGGTTGTSAFGTPSTFGTPAGNTAGGTGLFGSTANAGNSAFGGGGAFGGSKTGTSFGSAMTTSSNPNAGPYDGVAPVTTGTSSPAYAPWDDKDPTTSSTLHYQSITCMPAYRGCSFEELRVQDYAQGRKTASSGGAFGQPAFGSSTNQQPATGLFGQAAPTAQSSAFGGGAFAGANTSTPATGFGAFGQPSNTTANATGTGLFGGGAFGQQNQQQQPQAQPSAFGAFGQNQQQQPATGTSLFGGGAFGSNQNQQKPAFGAFGGTGTTGTFGGTGAFGQANQQQQQQQPSTGTSLFGQPQQQPAQPTGFGAFGAANNQPKPSIFGAPAATTTTTTTPFGGFGQNQQTQQNPQQSTQPAAGGLFGGGGLFGNNQQQQQQQQNQQAGQTTGLFGAQPAQPQQSTGTGLFGGGGGLFGNNNNQQQQQQQQQQQSNQQPAQTGGFGGLFGAKPANTTAPAGGGLFGGTFGGATNTQANNTQPAGGNLFGSTLGQNNNTTNQTTGGFGGGGLFGKPATNTFGTQQPAQTNNTFGGGGGLFGSTLGGSTSAPSAPQGGLTASIAQPIGANLPIFNMLPPGPRAIVLDPPKKKPTFFADIPTRSPVPRLALDYKPAASRLRGFNVSTTNGANGASLLTSGKPGALSLSKAGGNKNLLGPEALLNGSVSGAGLGSGGRQSVKKLVLDRKVDPADLFNKTGSPQPKAIFNPALSVAARELEAATGFSANALRSGQSPGPQETPTRKPNRFTAQAAAENQGTPTKTGEQNDPAELAEGEYYVKPDLDTLRNRGYEELLACSGLVVGRVGYGEIHFLEPVDLTGLQRLSALKGELVRFDDKECSVYPDVDDVDKPPPGQGLNVKARIILVRCWALDKATREPIKDEKHPMAIKHLKRLKHMKNTHFESFDISEGKWTFTVDHF